MGCGSSQRKKDARSQSRVTVAAQQRAEAAYRRQRIALEMEQTAVMRAEMEVERARLLKGLNSDRRPSYCRELVDLREELAEEVLENEVENKDIPRKINEAELSSVPNGHLGSRKLGREWQEKREEDDENGNVQRRNSNGQELEPDSEKPRHDELLQITETRSSQTSPSNVRFEENDQNVALCQTSADKDVELAMPVDSTETSNQENKDVNNTESNVAEHLSIVDDTDVNQDLVEGKNADNNDNLTTNGNENVTTSDEQESIITENHTADTRTAELSEPSELSAENNAESLEQVREGLETNSAVDFVEPARLASDSNEELDNNEKTAAQEDEEQVDTKRDNDAEMEINQHSATDVEELKHVTTDDEITSAHAQNNEEQEVTSVAQQDDHVTTEDDETNSEHAQNNKEQGVTSVAQQDDHVTTGDNETDLLVNA